MARINYGQVEKDKLILRDHLAADRTLLANERTILSYIRTSAAIAIGGITIIKFFYGLPYLITGWIFIIMALVILLFGITRCAYTTKCLSRFVKR